ncbi:MAG: hypothetical protein GXP62_07040 [Oligoflexia bacterium]|nr:hypothetical protein [Oligoflexia bacterium]
MSETLSFPQVQSLFDSLGVKDFGADLPEGRLHWTDAAGKVVATARCRAILSWAGGNHSALWADAIDSFKDAGVPCLESPDGENPYVEDIDELEAQEMAGQAAQLVSAQFLYAAPTGGGGKLFLAVTEFTPGGRDPDPADDARRVQAARVWTAGRLKRLGELLAQGEVDQVASLLGALSGQARQQADFVVRGTDLAPRLSGLATQAQLWASALPDQADRVAYELGIAAHAWEPTQE